MYCLSFYFPYVFDDDDDWWRSESSHQLTSIVPTKQTSHETLFIITWLNERSNDWILLEDDNSNTYNTNTNYTINKNYNSKRTEWIKKKMGMTKLQMEDMMNNGIWHLHYDDDNDGDNNMNEQLLQHSNNYMGEEGEGRRRRRGGHIIVNYSW